MNHTHTSLTTKHAHCKHERMAYCAECQAAYCRDCPKEWRDCTLNHWPTYIPYVAPVQPWNPWPITIATGGAGVTSAPYELLNTTGGNYS